MKIELIQTDDIYRASEIMGTLGGVLLRRWEGRTASGIPVHAFIALVSPQTRDPDVERQFAAELIERSVIEELPQ